MNSLNEAIREIGFVLYPVSDVPRARKFYSETLGLKETANWKDEWIEYDLGPGTLAITVGMPGIQAGANGPLAALEVLDFEAVAAFLKEKGVAWSMEPFDTPVCKGAMIRDPDGNALMIHQRSQKG